MKPCKHYNAYHVARFVNIIEEIVAEYERISQAENIRVAYLVYIGDGRCKICEYVSKFKLSCKAVCPFSVTNNGLCVDQPSYNRMSELCETETSRIVQIRILTARIKFLRDVISILRGFEW